MTDHIACLKLLIPMDLVVLQFIRLMFYSQIFWCLMQLSSSNYVKLESSGGSSSFSLAYWKVSSSSSSWELRLACLSILGLLLFTWYSPIISTIYILLLKYGGARSSTANPICIRYIHPNLPLLLGHHVPGIGRQEPLVFFGATVSGGLYKAGELISRHLLYILSENLISPWEAIFKVLHIP